eukprot:2593980-Amphidinium_carterae.1
MGFFSMRIELLGCALSCWLVLRLCPNPGLGNSALLLHTVRVFVEIAVHLRGNFGLSARSVCQVVDANDNSCLLYTSPSPRDRG